MYFDISHVNIINLHQYNRFIMKINTTIESCIHLFWSAAPDIVSRYALTF
jgi:hypothetical protein